MENALGDFLRNLRTGQQVSLTRLAAGAGVAKSTLSRWESGQFQPRLPELEAALGALNASRAQRERALALMRVPRALVRVQDEARSTASHAYLGALPTGGDLLRAMRHRRNRTQEQVAGALGVAARTVSRWERAQDWPSPERLRALGRLLGAREEEMTVLSAGPAALAPGHDNEPACPDAIGERLQSLIYDPISPIQAALMDLSYLTLEARAWRLALQSESVRPLVAQLYAWHANQLWLEQRFAETGQKVNQALDVLSQHRATPPFAIVAVIRGARVLAEGGARPAPVRGLDALRPWQERAAALLPEYHAWLLSEMALYAGQAGQEESALALSAQACQVAERAGNPAELPNRLLDHVQVLLHCQRPEAALDLLQQKGESLDSLDAALLGAEALLASGNRAEAHDQLQRASSLVGGVYAARGANFVTLRRRRADALARQF